MDLVAELNGIGFTDSEAKVTWFYCATTPPRVIN